MVKIGMYDDVACDAMHCPLCDSEMGWQSKDGPCTLETLTVHELMDETSKPVFYASCDDCQVWVEVSVTRRDERTPAQWAQYRKEREIIEAHKKDWDKPKEEGGTWDEEAFLLNPKDPHYMRGFLDYEPPADQPPRGEDPGINMDACWINGCTCDRPKPKRESPVPPHPTTFVLSREEIDNPPPDPVQEISKRHWSAYLAKEYQEMVRLCGAKAADAFFAPHRRTGADPTEDVQ